MIVNLLKFHRRSTLERDACLYEDESEYGDEVTGGRRKISSEFSPLYIGQHPDISWGSNIMDWFSDGSRKGSTTNLGTRRIYLLYRNHSFLACLFLDNLISFIAGYFYLLFILITNLINKTFCYYFETV